MSAEDLILIEAAGNRFALRDGFGAPPPADPAELARALRGRVDGLLLADPTAETDTDVRMTLYNVDGSRPEACGNGLRCVAAVAFEAGHVAGPDFVIATDAGPRPATVARGDDGSVVSVRTAMGTLTLGDALPFEWGGETLEVFPADAGNPHAVVFVGDVDGSSLEEIGPALEHADAFPNRTNVELVQVDGDSLRVRVWERGVGETGACGTGACAAACVSAARRGLSSPVRVRMPGGLLEVSWSSLADVRLSGPVRRLGTIRA